MTGRRQVRPVGCDAGVSLAELLVTMAVSTVLLLAVGAVFTSSLRVSQTSVARTGATADARLAMDTVARRLRVAVRPPGGGPMLAEARGRRVRFWASTTTATPSAPLTVLPTLVEYDVEGDPTCFREVLTRPDLPAGTTYPVVPTSSRCLVTGQLAALAGPLFTYYASADATTPLALVDGALPEASRELVQSIEITADVRDRRSAQAGTGASRVAPTHVQTRVTLVNRRNEELAGST